MPFVTNCATGWRDHRILQTKILDAKCGTFSLLQLCSHLSLLAREEANFFLWLFKWILHLVYMIQPFFCRQKSTPKKLKLVFTILLRQILHVLDREWLSFVSQSHAHRVKKRQINRKRGRDQGRERGKRALIFCSQGHPPSFLKTVINKEALPQGPTPFLVEKYCFRILSSIEKWYPST